MKTPRVKLLGPVVEPYPVQESKLVFDRDNPKDMQERMLGWVRAMGA